jgi:hypothetical protein
LILFFPFEPSGKHHQYNPFHGRSWHYPAYPRNFLDASPQAPKTSEDKPGNVYSIIGNTKRYLRPRKLKVRNSDGVWVTEKGSKEPYVFISYTREHFPSKRNRELERLAEAIAEDVSRREIRSGREGIKAYWLDYICMAKDQPELSKDIYRICDIIRGARQICVVLPNMERKSKRTWGERVWTMPEALLSTPDRVTFYSPSNDAAKNSLNGQAYLDRQEHSKTDLAHSVWPDGLCSRRLAEHYSGTLTLSRLELVYFAIKALRIRTTNDYSGADRAYALMSLLNYRPKFNPHDTLFQVYSRLSLANDSDRIVERIICLLSVPGKEPRDDDDMDDEDDGGDLDDESVCSETGDASEEANTAVNYRGERGIVHTDHIEIQGSSSDDVIAPANGAPQTDKQSSSLDKKETPKDGAAHQGDKKDPYARVDAFPVSDHLGARLWDIDPICQVAGVCGDRELLLSHCRGISIRWESFPRIGYRNKKTLKRRGASTLLRSGTAWVFVAILLLSYHNLGGGISFLAIGWLLLLAAPWSIVTLYGGKVWGADPWLIGFEGVMPINSVERALFGNARARLRYAPSSNEYVRPEQTERLAGEPDFVTDANALADVQRALPAGYRLFTLVDTGSLNVHIFAAQCPPSIALICGREGGMLRLVLCSFRLPNNCLQKETVLRVEIPMEDRSALLGWVKLRV